MGILKPIYDIVAKVNEAKMRVTPQYEVICRRHTHFFAMVAGYFRSKMARGLFTVVIQLAISA
jgi:hypothetical protein